MSRADRSNRGVPTAAGRVGAALNGLCAVHFADNDPHSSRNGTHHPVANGDAFIAEYGDELTLVDGDGFLAECIDMLAPGQSIAAHGAWGEVITVTRLFA